MLEVSCLSQASLIQSIGNSQEVLDIDLFEDFLEDAMLIAALSLSAMITGNSSRPRLEITK